MPQHMFNAVDSVSQFRRSLEEASRFLPPEPNLVTLKGGKKGRRNKQSALSLSDETGLSEAIDWVFLSEENVSDEQSCFKSGGKERPKKQGRKQEKETVDLWNLLLMCAQSKIRQHSSPIGNASERLARYFANGLEARLLGDITSAQGMYSILNSKRVTAAELLK
ncbi:hypothetical protein Fmac_022191 [Flemingia macrophylla]|uniref:Uncharacterized protein n=1 Tax=Flemingia macrophylla TaxID=520843 RepID=A0ABD1LZ19_9FABA